MIKPVAKSMKQGKAKVAAKPAKVQYSDDDDSDASSVDSPDAVAMATTTKKSTSTIINKKASSSSSRTQRDSNIIYIGHLPRHFQEHELLILLKQFGSVLHVRLSRSPKTGGSRGYAFVQFVEASVATIVANTLSGYLLDGKRLVCHVVAPDKIHKNMVYQFSKKKKIVSKERSLEKVQAISKRLLERQEKRKLKLAAAGIDYTFDGYTAPAAGDSATKKQQLKSEKKRKDSIASVESAVSEGSHSKKPKKRKTSIDGTASPDNVLTGATSSDDTKGRKRKDSLASVGSAISEGSETRKRRNNSVDKNEAKEIEAASTPKGQKLSAETKNIVSSGSKPKAAAKETPKASKKQNDSSSSSKLTSSQSPKATKAKTQPQSERKVKPADKKKSTRRKST